MNYFQAPRSCELDFGTIWKIKPKNEEIFEMEFRELLGLPIVGVGLSQETNTVTFSPMADVTIGCKMDLSSFPFDQQHCTAISMQIPRGITLRNLGAFLRDSLADFKGYRMKVTCMSMILSNLECKGFANFDWFHIGDDEEAD